MGCIEHLRVGLEKVWRRIRRAEDSLTIYPSAVLVGDRKKFTYGENVTIASQCFIYIGEGLHLGDNTYIHAGAKIIGGGTLRCGRNVSIGYNTVIATGTDTWQEGKQMVSSLPLEVRDVVRGNIELQDNVFIGANCVITVSKDRPLLLVGRNAVVGALSFVNEDIKATQVGFGQPYKWSGKIRRMYQEYEDYV